MGFGRRKKIDDQPTLADTGLNLELISELAKSGMVFDEVIVSDDLPEGAKALLPPELLEILGPLALFRQVEEPR